LKKQFRNLAQPEPHPLFGIILGKVREWEKIKFPTGVACRQILLIQ